MCVVSGNRTGRIAWDLNGPRRRLLEIVQLRREIALQVKGIVARASRCGLDALSSRIPSGVTSKPAS